MLKGKHEYDYHFRSVADTIWSLISASHCIIVIILCMLMFLSFLVNKNFSTVTYSLLVKRQLLFYCQLCTSNITNVLIVLETFLFSEVTNINIVFIKYRNSFLNETNTCPCNSGTKRRVLLGWLPVGTSGEGLLPGLYELPTAGWGMFQVHCQQWEEAQGGHLPRPQCPPWVGPPPPPSQWPGAITHYSWACQVSGCAAHAQLLVTVDAFSNLSLTYLDSRVWNWLTFSHQHSNFNYIESQFSL